MKNKKIYIIIIVSIIALLLGGGVYYYFNRSDATTTLSIVEKQWIENNKNRLVDFGIVNDVPIFSYNGKGVFLDFLESLETDTGLEFNKLSYQYGKESAATYKFSISKVKTENSLLMYEDNYVLVGKNRIKYNNLSDINGKVIGVVNADLDSINRYLYGANNLSFKTYESVDELFNKLSADSSEVDFIAVPKTIYLNKLLENEKLFIVYSISDYKLYYELTLGDEQKLNNILSKYFEKWHEEKFDSSFGASLVNNYFSFKNIEEEKKVTFLSKSYDYGFVEDAPFDKLNGSKLTGLNNNLIKEFSSITNISVNYNKFNSYKDLLESFNSNKIDFYFNTNSLNNYSMDVYDSNILINTEMAVVLHNSNPMVVNSVNSIIGNKVITVKDSKIENYLKSLGIDVNSYDNVNDAISKLKDDSIFVTDLSTYNYYKNSKLEDYRLEYSSAINDNYNYISRDINDNKIFNSLFSFYVSFKDDKMEINNAINVLVANEESKFNYLNFATYIMSILFLALVTYMIYSKFTNKEKKAKGINKEDKLKYIDMLTSLKNRNYLNDNMELWDNSEIYPQAIIIVDLNNIAYINDNYGHQEGDNVIKEAASALIRTQIENTEIIRTNGNEFLIYVLGYDEKQVISYIRKINKELKNIAHGFGAAAGYSMINDGIKTIDDAINEATIDMRNNKEDINNQ